VASSEVRAEGELETEAVEDSGVVTEGDELREAVVDTVGVALALDLAEAESEGVIEGVAVPRGELLPTALTLLLREGTSLLLDGCGEPEGDTVVSGDAVSEKLALVVSVGAGDAVASMEKVGVASDETDSVGSALGRALMESVMVALGVALSKVLTEGVTEGASALELEGVAEPARETVGEREGATVAEGRTLTAAEAEGATREGEGLLVLLGEREVRSECVCERVMEALPEGEGLVDTEAVAEAEAAELSEADAEAETEAEAEALRDARAEAVEDVETRGERESEGLTDEERLTLELGEAKAETEAERVAEAEGRGDSEPVALLERESVTVAETEGLPLAVGVFERELSTRTSPTSPVVFARPTASVSGAPPPAPTLAPVAPACVKSARTVHVDPPAVFIRYSPASTPQLPLPSAKNRLTVPLPRAAAGEKVSGAAAPGVSTKRIAAG
jgi:hypothetical protein